MKKRQRENVQNKSIQNATRKNMSPSRVAVSQRQLCCLVNARQSDNIFGKLLNTSTAPNKPFISKSKCRPSQRSTSVALRRLHR